MDLKDNNDKQLVLGLLADKVKAFDSIYSKYHQSLYSFILRYLKIPQLAEDVLQEVFLKIWEVRQNLKPELSLKAYLYRISRNLVYKQLKKIATDDELIINVSLRFASVVEDASVKAQWQEYEKILADAVRQLPQQRQKIFRLCRQEYKTYDEVAAELNISRNTVKEHMVLGIRFLREFIASKYEIDLVVFLLLLTRNHESI